MLRAFIIVVKTNPPCLRQTSKTTVRTVHLALYIKKKTGFFFCLTVSEPVIRRDVCRSLACLIILLLVFLICRAQLDIRVYLTAHDKLKVERPRVLDLTPYQKPRQVTLRFHILRSFVSRPRAIALKRAVSEFLVNSNQIKRGRNVKMLSAQKG